MVQNTMARRECEVGVNDDSPLAQLATASAALTRSLTTSAVYINPRLVTGEAVGPSLRSTRSFREGPVESRRITTSGKLDALEQSECDLFESLLPKAPATTSAPTSPVTSSAVKKRSSKSTQRPVSVLVDNSAHNLIHTQAPSATSLLLRLSAAGQSMVGGDDAKNNYANQLLFILKYRNSSDARDFFSFLRAEHSEEILLFFWKCEDWKEHYDKVCKGKDVLLVKLSAMEIYESFVEAGSEFEINLDEKDSLWIREQLAQGLFPSYTIFDDAQQCAYRMLLENKITRFAEFKKGQNKIKSNRKHNFKYTGFKAQKPPACAKCKDLVFANVVRCSGCLIVCHSACGKEVMQMGLICTGEPIRRNSNIFEVLPATNSGKACNILGGIPVAPISAPNKFHSQLMGEENRSAVQRFGSAEDLLSTKSDPASPSPTTPVEGMADSRGMRTSKLAATNFINQAAPVNEGRDSYMSVPAAIARRASCKLLSDSLDTFKEAEHAPLRKALSSSLVNYDTPKDLMRTRVHAKPSEDPEMQDIYAPAKAAKFFGVIPTLVPANLEGKPFQMLGSYGENPPLHAGRKATKILGNNEGFKRGDSLTRTLTTGINGLDM
ncbi:hypothetical protein SARC_03420 [Sphaeroforma arctica JP610]|uniref:RGS domain-containing protein n=1 Tax=Sphaeroforma arctica JP610 TaxID=667725 RepID=A0A0L0G5S0_9EUKA|nr:hypothetical protein SARC_03420 [Sphaeroforma arctica JP610]KNC84375.1 hypothetical protein SARC_03420 [Sphaeroforma arctica JP610]|eukprot:XP_014158277.1 hypothetical protein SARC_03420 [Sphaeroforma arctica JP610]